MAHVLRVTSHAIIVANASGTFPASIANDHGFAVQGLGGRSFLEPCPVSRDLRCPRQVPPAVDTAAERVLELQETDRRRIAVELHDSTGQHLVALGMALGQLQRLAPETEVTAPIFGDIRASLDEAQRELRVFSYLLHPPFLGEDGLAFSLHRFLRGFERRSKLKVVKKISERADEADLEVRRAAFRIIQEAISNVHRHAHATLVSVELRVDSRLRILVSDNGLGFLGGVSEPEPGVGVNGMRARATQIGGEFSILSGQKGVTVKVALPLRVR